MSEIVPSSFNFDGEQFPVVRMPNGDIGLPLRRLTVPIGLNPDGQRKLIERSAWSKGRTDNMYVRLPGDDRVRQHFVISYRIIPMWIANVETGRMKDQDARKRIERWQVEFADALYNYVFNGGASNPRAVAAEPVAQLPVPEPFTPKTFPLAEVVVLIKQKFGVRISVADLKEKLRQAGAMRQDDRPRSGYEALFWHTGEVGKAYEVFGHQIEAVYRLYESTKLRLEMAAQKQLALDPPGWPELPLGEVS
ncbi:phage antirepressor N-terminal domain-containing protein [Streptosporangium sp. NPDC051023]|uniref:phage antirepressor N-terminal domain-containing protein n=1 Tax=Streptosporangium sp. NPDC051023 TaxID=3155410 RepID=UPI00344E6AF0